MPIRIVISQAEGLAAQDFSRDPLRTGDRAVDRRVLAIGFRGFPREEERPIEWRPQLLPRDAAADSGIAVGAARERIGLPVVTESATQSDRSEEHTSELQSR